MDTRPPLPLGIDAPSELTFVNGNYDPNPFTINATVENSDPNSLVDNVQLTLNVPSGLTIQGNPTANIGMLAAGSQAQYTWTVSASLSALPNAYNYSVTATGTGIPSKTVTRAVFVPAVQCPWGGTVVTPEPGTNDPVKCQYTFNAQQRHKAAEYAVSWAAGACPMFCAFQYHPYVTPTPPYPSQQSQYDCADPSKTDCANFVSQAYLYAGWPMTKDWYCAIYSNNLCVRGNSAKPGWALASRIGHGLPEYIELDLASPFNTLTFIYDKNKPALEQPPDGCFGADGFGNLTEPQIRYCLENFLNSDKIYPSLYSKTLGDGEKVKTIWSYLSQHLKQSDLMATSDDWNLLDDEHVAIIVGWGPYVSTWEELETIPLTDIKPHYDGVKALVPYIVDHGLHGTAQYKTQSSTLINAIKGYKPYYAIRWPAVKGANNYIAGSWHFFHIPDNFELPFTSILTPGMPYPNSGSTVPLASFTTTMATICPITKPLPIATVQSTLTP